MSNHDDQAKPSALHQHPQRDQSGQTEAEPTSYELVRIGQEEDAPAQRCDEHEEPREATHTGRIAVVSSTPLQAIPSIRPVAGKLDLDLPGFQPADDLLQ
jgi:hypothetical protein